MPLRREWHTDPHITPIGPPLVGCSGLFASHFERRRSGAFFSGNITRSVDVEDLRQALLAFKERYNQEWLIARLGYRSPAQVRQAFALTTAA